MTARARPRRRGVGSGLLEALLSRCRPHPLRRAPPAEARCSHITVRRVSLDLPGLKERLDATLVTLAKQHVLPGLALSVRRNGREVFAGACGSRDAQATLPVTCETLFGVASVTKVLTVVMIMQARRDNLLQLSDPVSRFYPKLDCAHDGKMQIWHLMSHSAGFPGLPFRHMATRSASASVPDPIMTPDELVTRINALEFDFLGPPGNCVSYCNEGFCLLGGVIEAVYDCSFAEAAERRVFRPLDMTRSVIGASAAAAIDDVAIPLRLAGSGYQSCGFWDAPLFDPAGGLVLSASDMSRLISLLGGTTGGLAPDDVSDMISTSLHVASRPGYLSRYGLGLEVTRLDDGHSLLWHSGQRPGISSFTGYIPEKAVSVALATNIADAPSVSIGHQIIAEALQGDLDPRSCRWPPLANETRPKEPERFCGDFASLEALQLSVCLDDGQLVLDSGATRQRLRFSGPSHGTAGAQTFCFLGDEGPATDGEFPRALALDLRIMPRRCAA